MSNLFWLLSAGQGNGWHTQPLWGVVTFNSQRFTKDKYLCLDSWFMLVICNMLQICIYSIQDYLWLNHNVRQEKYCSLKLKHPLLFLSNQIMCFYRRSFFSISRWTSTQPISFHWFLQLVLAESFMCDGLPDNLILSGSKGSKTQT